MQAAHSKLDLAVDEDLHLMTSNMNQLDQTGATLNGKNNLPDTAANSRRPNTIDTIKIRCRQQADKSLAVTPPFDSFQNIPIAKSDASQTVNISSNWRLSLPI